MVNSKYASKVLCKYASIQVCKYANMQVCVYASMQVWKIAIIEAWKSTSMKTCKPTLGIPYYPKTTCLAIPNEPFCSKWLNYFPRGGWVKYPWNTGNHQLPNHTAAKLCHEMTKPSCCLDFDFHLLLSNITVHLCIEHQNNYLCISLGLLVFNSGDCPEMRTIVKWIMFYWFTSKGPEVTKVDVTIWCLSIHWLCFVNFTTNQLVLTKQACIPCL